MNHHRRQRRHLERHEPRRQRAQRQQFHAHLAQGVMHPGEKHQHEADHRQPPGQGAAGAPGAAHHPPVGVAERHHAQHEEGRAGGAVIREHLAALDGGPVAGDDQRRMVHPQHAGQQSAGQVNRRQPPARLVPAAQHPVHADQRRQPHHHRAQRHAVGRHHRVQVAGHGVDPRGQIAGDVHRRAQVGQGELQRRRRFPVAVQIQRQGEHTQQQQQRHGRAGGHDVQPQRPGIRPGAGQEGGSRVFGHGFRGD